MVSKMKRVITYGTFDMLHINHLKMIEYARALGDILIVGVNTDELVASYKSEPIIPFEERIEIIKAIKYVDMAVPQENKDKIAAYNKYKFDVMFVGDDWKGSSLFSKCEVELKKHNCDVIYFPYTKGTSSTILREKVLNYDSKDK